MVRRRIPYVQQLTANECGAACLSMVLGYHGKAVRTDELRQVAASARDGSDAAGLITAARHYQLEGRAVSLDLDQLDQLPRGAILHWDFRHFVVFDGRHGNTVSIVDPGAGRRRVPIDDFSRHFTGVALIFEPGSGFVRARQPRKLRTRYLRLFLEQRRLIAQLVAASALLQIAGLGIPILTRIVIDSVVPRSDRDLLWLLTVGAAVLIVFQSWCALIRSHVMTVLRTTLDARMTGAFLEHLLRLPYAFFQRRSSGDIMSRIRTNASVREILTGAVLSTFLDGSLAVGYLIFLFSSSRLLGAVTLGLGLLQALTFLVTRQRQRRLLVESLEAQNQSQGHQMETFMGIETLKVLGAERGAIERSRSLLAAELNVLGRRSQVDAAVEAATQLVRAASAAILLVIAAREVLGGRLSVGEMIALIAVAAGFLAPLTALLSSVMRLQLLGIYLDRLEDVFQSPVEAGPGRALPAPPLDRSLKVNAVTFRYAPISPPVLSRITLEIAAGEFVAIVGRSGSGKSTLAKLLVGLYEPEEGSILVDGVEMRAIDPVALRRRIGMVSQDPQLFGTSIRQNIALADDTMPLETVVAAARAARIHDDIEAMPMGYDTLLIDRGASLSGGQRQRLAIARVLMVKPALLVLDESTNQLDPETERSVLTGIREWCPTRVLITHRLSTVADADRIIVMDRGRIVEEGRHADLMAGGRLYPSLVAITRSA